MPTTVKKRPNGSKRVQFATGDKSRVEQHHRDEVNINTIMRKMHAQGVLPHFKNGGTFGDFSSVTDFQDCKNRIIAANNDFMRLPSELRFKFDNDPGLLVEWLQDPDNASEARDMGLIPPVGYKPPSEEKTSQEAAQAPEKQDKPSDVSA